MARKRQNKVMEKMLDLILGIPPAYGSRPIRTHGSKGHSPRLCMHFYTYGQSLRSEPKLSEPTIIRVNCVRLKPPPDYICEGRTGLDRKVADNFFSNSKNQRCYQKALDQVEDFLDQVEHYLDRHDNDIGCVAIMVSCYIGVHRSVAMAERLATDIEKRWTGLSVHCRHLDLGKEIERQRRAKYREGYWPRVARWLFGG